MEKFLISYVFCFRDFAKPPSSDNVNRYVVHVDNTGMTADRFSTTWTGWISNYAGVRLRSAETRTMAQSPYFHHEIILSDQEVVQCYTLSIVDLDNASQEAYDINFQNLTPPSTNTGSALNIRNFSQSAASTVAGWECHLADLHYTNYRTLERKDRSSDHKNPVLSAAKGETSTKTLRSNYYESSFVSKLNVTIIDYDA